MAELLVAPDAEEEIRRELLAWPFLSGMPVSTDLPKDPKPPGFVRVVRTGGAERDMVTDEATCTVECFSESETTASRLAALSRAALSAAARDGRMGNATCYGAQILAAPANLPHPDVPTHHRYTFTMSVELRMLVVRPDPLQKEDSNAC